MAGSGAGGGVGESDAGAFAVVVDDVVVVVFGLVSASTSMADAVAVVVAGPSLFFSDKVDDDDGDPGCLGFVSVFVFALADGECALGALGDRQGGERRPAAAALAAADGGER